MAVFVYFLPVLIVPMMKYSQENLVYTYLSFSKFIEYDDINLTLGLNVFNVFDIRNPIDIYPETGDPTTRSEYYTQEIGLPEEGKTISNSFYDTPWHFSSPREINFFMRFDYK